jgi:membrane protein YqaA with SNARE-associated domain
MSAETETVSRGGPLRGLYFWLMRHAEGRHAWTMLAVVSFAEASFFPIPPDVMLVPMALADRSRALLLAGWCMLWSVLGGLLGYAIGSLLYDSVGHWLISVYGYGSDLEKFRSMYAEYGAWIILIKGATPIPYKLVTIASGFAGYNLFLFVVLSAITRGLRFGIVAGLLAYFGEPIRNFIEKRLEYVMIGFLALIIAGFLVARYVV